MSKQILVASLVVALAPSTSPPKLEDPAPIADFEIDISKSAKETEKPEKAGQTGGPACAGYAVMAAIECSAVFPIACVAGTVLAACECMPLILDEFAEFSCPGFG